MAEQTVVGSGDRRPKAPGSNPQFLRCQRRRVRLSSCASGFAHWEGDLIIGLKRSAIGTLVERTTRFTMLLHLPRLKGYGKEPRVKNGPALAGQGAEAVRDAIASAIRTLPEQLRCSLTWDQGAEMARHHELRFDTGPGVLLRSAQSVAA